MKKTFSLAIAAAGLLALSACGGSETATNESETVNTGGDELLDVNASEALPADLGNDVNAVDANATDANAADANAAGDAAADANATNGL